MRFNPRGFPPVSALSVPRPWENPIPAYAMDCETRARGLLQHHDLTEDDRERLETVLHTLQACYNADHLLVLPVDSWTLLASATADLLAIEAKYEVR
jgi:hypothetical protein